MIPDEAKMPETKNGKGITRRQFIVGTGAAVVAGGVIVGALDFTVFPSRRLPANVAEPPSPVSAVNAAPASITTATAYLVHDSKKCAGCLSCMAACSMAHDKSASLSVSRIQIAQAPLAPFPFDLDQYICRHCSSPLCVQNCPTGACHIDTANGNVRVIDQSKCIGCQTCIRTCPHPPHRVVWNTVAKKATKCDLCADAPYLGEKGGPGGAQACVSACPVGALKVVTTVPDQTDEVGYDVNLRAVPKA